MRDAPPDLVHVMEQQADELYRVQRLRVLRQRFVPHIHLPDADEVVADEARKAMVPHDPLVVQTRRGWRTATRNRIRAEQGLMVFLMAMDPSGPRAPLDVFEYILEFALPRWSREGKRLIFDA